MSLILYLDRVCMSKAVKSIQEEFDLSGKRMAVILMAFTLAYGLFEIPTGRWGDRYGARRVLTRIVLWWSAFTALTAACFGFWSLVGVRFLFGAGEAGAYPNAARVITRWFPARERGRVQGLVLSAGLIGGSFAPALAAYVIQSYGWRAVFLMFGSVGVFWALLYFWWFRDDPALHASVNDAERAEIGPAGSPRVHSSIPWRQVFRTPTIWLLGTITSCNSFISYLYFSWYPTYLEKGREASPIQAGWLATLVLGAGAAGVLAGGIVVDRMSRYGVDPGRLRRRFCSVALALSACAMAGAVQANDAVLSASLTATSCLLMFLQQSTWWSSATEVSGPHVGSLFGLMNGLGVVGAMSSQFFFGAFVDWRKAEGYLGRDQWDPAFYVCVVVLAASGLCWTFVNLTRRVGDSPSPSRA